MQKLQKREVRLNRQEFLHKVRDIAGDDAPALRHALKQLTMDRSASEQTLPLIPPSLTPSLPTSIRQGFAIRLRGGAHHPSS